MTFPPIKLDWHFFANFLFIGGHYAEALCRMKVSYQRSPYPWLSLNSLEVNYLLRCTIYLLSKEPSEPLYYHQRNKRNKTEKNKTKQLTNKPTKKKKKHIHNHKKSKEKKKTR